MNDDNLSAPLLPTLDVADTLAPHEQNLRRRAKLLYWQGFRVVEIAPMLELPESTVYTWKARDGWDACPITQRITIAMDYRLTALINKDNKGNNDYKEIDSLMRQVERLAKIERFGITGKESHINEKRAGNHIDKRAPANFVPDEKITELQSAFQDGLFGYQKLWLANKTLRIRDILKSRQIGATWYFAREALIDALITGDNQIFLSASRAQAEVFRSYIIQFAASCGIELKGNPITLANRQDGGAGATLYFLSTSSRTAQSYHGHLYFDEIFWVPKFKELNKVASGMAMHKNWRKTYFSTPSAITHEAYEFWTGKGKLANKEELIDVSHANLKDGLICADGQWRQIVTITDAIASGCNLFNIEQLQQEYTEEEYRQLLMCEFIDDAESIFQLNELLLCGVDSLVAWRDYSRTAAHPLGDRGVWVGYDPSRTRDNAAVVVISPPNAKGAAFRVLEKHEWKGLDFVRQAEAIKSICGRYKVDYIGIDTTGIGLGVYDIVHNFYPATKKINYSPETKSRLVLRAKELVRSRRVQWDSGWNDLMRAFMAIQRITTDGGKISFDAARSSATGHADLAWATMIALDAQPFRQVVEGGTTAILEIF